MYSYTVQMSPFPHYFLHSLVHEFIMYWALSPIFLPIHHFIMSCIEYGDILAEDIMPDISSSHWEKGKAAANQQ